MYDLTSQRVLAGAAGAGAKLYVEDVFSTWLYTGNGSTQTITNGIDLSGKGGLVWLKRRNDISEHGLYDTARGAANLLQSQATAAQISSYSGVSAFAATGFDLGTELNASGGTYASWTFRKAAKFFDVVTYTGNGSPSGKVISHNLGSVPGFIICKRVTFSGAWAVCARTGAGTYATGLSLNSTNAALYSGALGDAPTSTTFNTNGIFDASGDYPNFIGDTYVAYLFAHDAGGFGDSGNDSVVKCGNYVGTGSPGNFVDLGWEPQWLLIKRRSGGTGDWVIHDSMRGIATDGPDPVLYPNKSDAEVSTNVISLNATGFTVEASNATWNASGSNYIYIAIRRGPMKTPTDATKVFAASLGAATTPAFTSNFPVDLALTSYRSGGGGNHYMVDRIRGQRSLETPSTAAESAVISLWKLDQQTGFAQSSGGWDSTHVCSMFRRAPGFFDVVAYTGDSNFGRIISHNLGVNPEIIILKSRSLGGTNWVVWASALGTSNYLTLESSSSTTAGSSISAVSSNSFTISTNGGNFNSSPYTYIAYLFASCPGVSKVGSYTGTGTTLQVNCGFTSGARFVLIKRTDSTGDWYVWDSARGIVAGNDPYLLLNSTAAEVTGTDYVDTFSSGFEISSTAPAAINANGGNFIFLAVA